MKVYAKERGYCLLRDINGGYILIGELGIEKCEQVRQWQIKENAPYAGKCMCTTTIGELQSIAVINAKEKGLEDVNRKHEKEEKQEYTKQKTQE